MANVAQRDHMLPGARWAGPVVTPGRHLGTGIEPAPVFSSARRIQGEFDGFRGEYQNRVESSFDRIFFLSDLFLPFCKKNCCVSFSS